MQLTLLMILCRACPIVSAHRTRGIMINPVGNIRNVYRARGIMIDSVRNIRLIYYTLKFWWLFDISFYQFVRMQYNIGYILVNVETAKVV